MLIFKSGKPKSVNFLTGSCTGSLWIPGKSLLEYGNVTNPLSVYSTSAMIPNFKTQKGEGLNKVCIPAAKT